MARQTLVVRIVPDEQPPPDRSAADNIDLEDLWDKPLRCDIRRQHFGPVCGQPAPGRYIVRCSKCGGTSPHLLCMGCQAVMRERGYECATCHSVYCYG